MGSPRTTLAFVVYEYFCKVAQWGEVPIPVVIFLMLKYLADDISALQSGDDILDEILQFREDFALRFQSTKSVQAKSNRIESILIILLSNTNPRNLITEDLLQRVRNL